VRDKLGPFIFLAFCCVLALLIVLSTCMHFDAVAISAIVD
jgi:hypothetical protein